MNDFETSVVQGNAVAFCFGTVVTIATDRAADGCELGTLEGATDGLAVCGFTSHSTENRKIFPLFSSASGTANRTYPPRCVVSISKENGFSASNTAEYVPGPPNSNMI